MSALWRIVLMRFWRSLSGILACNPKPLPLVEGLCMLGGLCIVQSLLAYTPSVRAGRVIGGSKAELLKISRKADRDAPCDQARMLDSVRTEVVSTDAYKWSHRVGARCTDHTRPQMHRCKTHKRTQTCIGASPKARML